MQHLASSWVAYFTLSLSVSIAVAVAVAVCPIFVALCGYCCRYHIATAIAIVTLLHSCRRPDLRSKAQ